MHIINLCTLSLHHQHSRSFELSRQCFTRATYKTQGISPDRVNSLNLRIDIRPICQRRIRHIPPRCTTVSQTRYLPPSHNIELTNKRKVPSNRQPITSPIRGRWDIGRLQQNLERSIPRRIRIRAIYHVVRALICQAPGPIADFTAADRVGNQILIISIHRHGPEAEVLGLYRWLPAESPEQRLIRSK